LEQWYEADGFQTTEGDHHLKTSAVLGGAHPEGMFHGAVGWTPAARAHIPFHFCRNNTNEKRKGGLYLQ